MQHPTITGTISTSGAPRARVVQQLIFAQYDDVNVPVAVVNDQGQPFNLTGSLVVTVRRHLTASTDPLDVLLSRQVTVDNAAAGLGHFTINAADNVPPGLWHGDLVYTAPGVGGAVDHAIDELSTSVSVSHRVPGAAVTVPASSAPLAQGPPGLGVLQNAATFLAQRSAVQVDGTLLVATDDPVNNRSQITAPGLAPKTRTISTAAGQLTGGGDLSADRTLGLASTGPGAGTYGGTGKIPYQIGLDGQGRAASPLIVLHQEFHFEDPAFAGGADPTGVAPADAVMPAIMAAMGSAALRKGSRLVFGRGVYTFAGTLTSGVLYGPRVTRPCDVIGQGGGVNYQTLLNFPSNVPVGLQLDSSGSALDGGASNWINARNFAILGATPPVWQAGHAYVVGNIIMPPDYAPNFTGYVYRCTVAGTSGGSPPAFTVRNDVRSFNTDGLTFTDGGVTWKATPSAGMFIKTSAFVRNVYVQGWPGDAFFAQGYSSGAPDSPTGWNGVQLSFCQAQLNLGRGFNLEGTDAQASVLENNISQGNNRGGFADWTDVGNQWTAPLGEANGISAWGANGSTGLFTSGYVVPKPTTIEALIALGVTPSFFKLITPGTTGATEPLWQNAPNLGNQINDNGVVWQNAGPYLYGQGWTARRAASNASVIINPYMELDNRANAADFPVISIGSTGGLWTLDSTALILATGQQSNGLGFTSRRQAQPIQSWLGPLNSGSSTRPTAFAWNRGGSGNPYEIMLSADNNYWDFLWGLGQQTAFRLTEQNAPEGPGKFILPNALLLGTAQSHPVRLTITTCDVSAGNAPPTTAELGDVCIQRTNPGDFAAMWFCVQSGVGNAVWAPMHCNTAAAFTVTGTVGSPTLIGGFPNQHRNWTNLGQGGVTSYCTLPQVASPQSLEFRIHSEENVANAFIHINAGANQIIKGAGLFSTSGGSITNSTLGACVVLRSKGTGIWVCESQTGTWVAA